MRVLLATILVCHCAGCLFAQQVPLTVKEISLMLRSGCSSEMILRDLSARHFAGPLDVYGRSELIQANASPALLDALKSPDNAASNEQLAEALQRIADGKAAAQRATQQRAAVAAQEAAAYRAAAAAERATAQKGAERKESDLDMRVRMALSTPWASFGLGEAFSVPSSPDQKRVYERAEQVANEKYPPQDDRFEDYGMSKTNVTAGERQHFVRELCRDEAFVRDTLSR